MLLAMEDGFRLHRLVEAESLPADSLFHPVADLQKLARG
jgi:hypothetical protein